MEEDKTRKEIIKDIIKMNLIKNFKEVIKKAKDLKREDLELFKYILIFGIVMDMFGLYWFLSAKRLGLAVMMVLIVGLIIIMLLERRLSPSPKTKETIKKKEVKKWKNKMLKKKETKMILKNHLE